MYASNYSLLKNTDTHTQHQNSFTFLWLAKIVDSIVGKFVVLEQIQIAAKFFQDFRRHFEEHDFKIFFGSRLAQRAGKKTGQEYGKELLNHLAAVECVQSVCWLETPC